jgi:hypothetical protein
LAGAVPSAVTQPLPPILGADPPPADTPAAVAPVRPSEPMPSSRQVSGGTVKTARSEPRAAGPAPTRSAARAAPAKLPASGL